MTTTVYRFSTSTALPLHWSYLDAFDDDGKDNRQSGFQVWTDLEAVRAAQVHHDDGDFSTSAYPYVLAIVVVGDLSDGCGEWYSVRPKQVIAVRVLAADAFATGADFDAASTVPIEFVETLPVPDGCTLVECADCGDRYARRAARDGWTCPECRD